MLCGGGSDCFRFLRGPLERCGRCLAPVLTVLVDSFSFSFFFSVLGILDFFSFFQGLVLGRNMALLLGFCGMDGMYVVMPCAGPINYGSK